MVNAEAMPAVAGPEQRFPGTVDDVEHGGPLVRGWRLVREPYREAVQVARELDRVPDARQACLAVHGARRYGRILHPAADHCSHRSYRLRDGFLDL